MNVDSLFSVETLQDSTTAAVSTYTAYDLLLHAGLEWLSSPVGVVLIGGLIHFLLAFLKEWKRLYFDRKRKQAGLPLKDPNIPDENDDSIPGR